MKFKLLANSLDTYIPFQKKITKRGSFEGNDADTFSHLFNLKETSRSAPSSNLNIKVNKCILHAMEKGARFVKMRDVKMSRSRA